jgi:hypothetical protein
MKSKILFFLSVLLITSSCKDIGTTLPSVTGSRFEILVVMNDSSWKAPSGRALLNLLNQDMPALPQSEPMLRITQCTQNQFGDLFKPTRNLLLTDISDKYTAPKIIYSKDKWAQPQAVVRIVAPNDSSFRETIEQYGPKILDYFIKMERERQIYFNKEYINHTAKNEVEEMFGIQIDIPQGIIRSTKGKDFYWITNDQPNVRQDIVIYSYPYRDKNTFSKEYLIAKRDSVMKANLPGEFEGSYMGTELKYDTPNFKEVWVNDGYCAELTGLWKIMNGGGMGGPFYSHTRLDEINQRVITMEGFVFAPGTTKRNHIRYLEAVIYSAKLPQEINALKEISVTAGRIDK